MSMRTSRLGTRGAVVLLLTGVAPLAAAAQGAATLGWEQTVAAANQEGALVMSGPSGKVWRDQLMEFAKSYPAIKLDITPFASRDFWPRVTKEREVGEYLWDLRVGGADAPSYNLKNQGVLAPIRPLLALPEVLDETKWMGGLDGLFLDKEKTYFVAFAAYDSQSLYYNRAKIDGAGLTTKSLTDAKWRGKISMADPRAGASLNTLSVMDKVYGDAFVEQLMSAQAPVITKEPRQQMDWLSSGRYPIAFGLPSIAFVEYGQRGGRVDEFVKVPGLQLWSPGVGGIQVPSKGPHPAATKLFVNWLLSREVQARLMPAVQLNSRRADVKPGDPETALDPAQIASSIATQSEDLLPFEHKTVEILRKTTP
jgi:ABC-type Fe3+ transport system substrate-binding protein